MKTRTRPRGQGGRFALNRLPFAAIIIVIMVAGIAIAAAWGSGSDKNSTARNANTVRADPCEDAREACATLYVNGREWRYSLLRSSTPTKITAILDLGGPGIAPLSGGLRLADFQSQLNDVGKYNVLVLEEPWVTARVDRPCQGAATTYYNNARLHAKEIVASARTLHDLCGLGRGKWGFNPQEYSQVVAAIAGKESLELRGFVGFSFGIARYSYLAATSIGERIDWAVLARPFPFGTDATTFVRQRAALLEGQFGEAPSSFKQTSTPSRSVPVTLFDNVSAIVGLGYAPEGEQAEVSRAVMTQRDPEVIGQYSDNLWHRYGIDSISPAYLAQLDEICGATTSSEKLPNAFSGQPLARTIAETLLPCAGQPSRNLKLRQVPTCVIVSKSDPVVAGDISMVLIHRAVKNVSVINSNISSHQSQDGLSSCLKGVLSSRSEQP